MKYTGQAPVHEVDKNLQYEDLNYILYLNVSYILNAGLIMKHIFTYPRGNCFLSVLVDSW